MKSQKNQKKKLKRCPNILTQPFSLKNYPEFNGVYEIKDETPGVYYTFLEDYFSEELVKYGKKKAKDIVSVGGGGWCTEFDFEKNLLRFRIRMEKYDLNLKFISKKDDIFYLTNLDRSRLVKLKVTERWPEKDSSYAKVRYFKLFSFHPEQAIASGRGNDSESYLECIDFYDTVEETTRGMSKDDLGGPDGRDQK
jgi:hypothetical protein